MSEPRDTVWPVDKARQWYASQPFLIGANFTPSTASNQIEFWRAASFDPQTIDRELGYAAAVGFNAMRTYLHDAVWKADPAGFKDRLNQYLDIADRHGIATMFCFFDDCWHGDIDITADYTPVPGVHNSRWLQSPGHDIVDDPSQWPALEDYVKDILTTFAHDPRVNIWDLYNEPGNGSVALDGGTRKPRADHSLPLLKATFQWARQVNPTQPLTAAVYAYREEFANMNRFQLAESDITSFHCYGDADELRQRIATCRQGEGETARPMLCSEWLARGEKLRSRFQTHMPIFAEQNISCYNWGLVVGRIQTHQPWGSKEGDPEANPWHHDVLRADGTPYDPQEIEAIKDARNTVAARST
jgi:hypothetical protein